MKPGKFELEKRYLKFFCTYYCKYRKCLYKCLLYILTCHIAKYVPRTPR